MFIKIMEQRTSTKNKLKKLFKNIANFSFIYHKIIILLFNSRRIYLFCNTLLIFFILFLIIIINIILCSKLLLLKRINNNLRFYFCLFFWLRINLFSLSDEIFFGVQQAFNIFQFGLNILFHSNQIIFINFIL